MEARIKSALEDIAAGVQKPFSELAAVYNEALEYGGMNNKILLDFYTLGISITG